MDKKMTFLCLVRHGETEWNLLRKIQGRTDIPLNETGKNQALDCKRYLSSLQWDLIVSSPLKRATKTADIINESMNLPYLIMDDFIERNYGSIEGLTLEQRENLNPDFQCPAQEKQDVLISRVMSGMNQLHQQYKNKRIIVVAHGGVINRILSFLSEGALGSGKTSLYNGSLTYIQFQEGKWHIKDYNQTTHISRNQLNIN